MCADHWRHVLHCKVMSMLWSRRFKRGQRKYKFVVIFFSDTVQKKNFFLQKNADEPPMYVGVRGGGLHCVDGLMHLGSGIRG